MSELRFNLGPWSHIIIDIADSTYDEDHFERRRDSQEVTAEATERAKQLQDWYNETHPGDVTHTDTIPEQPYEGPDGDPGPEPPQQMRPQQRQEPQQEQPRYGAGSGVETREQMLGRSWGDCPECNQPARASKMEYQEWEKTDDGVEVPAKHYCANQQCPTKSLWRRQLFVPQGAHDSREDGLPF